MMTVGSYEAKTKLPELLKRVELGEHITIARHGRPIAVLIPAASIPVAIRRPRSRPSRSSRCGRRRGDFDIRAAIEEGRRY